MSILFIFVFPFSSIQIKSFSVFYYIKMKQSPLLQSESGTLFQAQE